MVVIAAGEASRAGRGGERAVAPDGEVVVAHDVVVDVADGCAVADQELQRPGCRICHLVDGDGDGELPQRLSGRLVRLGCDCRGELAAAHGDAPRRGSLSGATGTFFVPWPSLSFFTTTLY